MEKKKPERILITAGGTGGHIYPALALARQLQDEGKELFFVAGGLASNRYFDPNLCPYKEVSCGKASLRHVGKILKGIWQSYSLIRKFSPQLLVGFGSYHTLPVLIAAKLAGVPLLLHEANRIPGRVNRLMAPYAHAIGVLFPDTPLKGHKQHVSLPLRPGYKLTAVDKGAALRHFSLSADKKTVLVFGGSLGAQSINQVLLRLIPRLSQAVRSNIQLLHFTGTPQAIAEVTRCYAEYGVAACVKEFESRMEFAWRTADLVIARAGGGAISEQLEFEVPGILIPYPQAMDDHQTHNANFMQDIVGGAIVQSEKSLDIEKLATQISALIADSTPYVIAMRQYKQKWPPIDLCTFVNQYFLRK